MKTSDVLLRIEAFRKGAALPVGTTFPWPKARDEDRLILCFVRMAGESLPWGFAAGHPGGEPTVLSVPEPRNADEQARLTRDLGTLLLPHLPHPEHTTPEEQADIGVVVRRRQLWVPGSTHLEMLHFLDFRFSQAREGEAGVKDLNAIGRAAGFLFRESTRPGQVRVFDLTRRLRDAFAVPAEDVRQAHLGFLLAWIDGSGSRDERIARAREAERLSVGVTMSPELEREVLVKLVERYNAEKADPTKAAPIAREIRAVLDAELRRRYQLAERALALLDGDGRPPNPELEGLIKLGVEEHVYQYWNVEHKAAAPQVDPNAPRNFGNHPETDFSPVTAAARFFAHQHAQDVASAELLHGDPALIEAAIEAGDALRGTIVNVVNEGTKRSVTPVWTVRAPAEGVLRLREESGVCVAGLRGRTGSIRSIEVVDGERVVTVEIDGWKRARPEEGAPAAEDAAALEGTAVTLVASGVTGLSRKKSFRVWESSGPGAWLTHAAPLPERAERRPFEGDLIALVEKLGGR
ncbi:MAG: hypothetical protein U0359_08980 [Byssovorax sp.]